MRALYITPMKSPDDPAPSGDRTIARATESILTIAGFSVERVALVTHLNTPDIAAMDAAKQGAERIVAQSTMGPPPDLVFTYHCYYKAPDLVGPAIAQHFRVPYLIAEGSHAPKRAQSAWGLWHGAAERALKAATMILVASPQDRDGLCHCVDVKRLRDWPPFIDEHAWPIMPRWTKRNRIHLLTVAMMREGDKFESYRLLAAALARLKRHDWHLTLVGDGPMRETILSLFRPFGEQIAWRGQIDGLALADAYADADLLVWPAINEALGMVFLEAALQACPALAGDEGGVASIVHHAKTGWLVPRRDADAFAAALDALIADPQRLISLGEEASRMAQQCTLEHAARRLQDYLQPLGLVR